MATVDELDGHDRQIVQLLGADGRMSYTELAKHTGLSTSAAHQRVRRLEQRGVITAYRAIVDLEAIGLPMTAFVSISPIDPADPDDIPDRVAHLRAVESCYSVAGDHNYVLEGAGREPGGAGAAARRSSGQRPRDDPDHRRAERPLREPAPRSWARTSPAAADVGPEASAAPRIPPRPGLTWATLSDSCPFVRLFQTRRGWRAFDSLTRSG